MGLHRESIESMTTGSGDSGVSVERLRALMTELDLGPVAVAAAGGTSRQAVTRWLKGDTKPHMGTLRRTIEALEEMKADREPGEERYVPQSELEPEIEFFDIPGFGHAVFRNIDPEKVGDYLREIFRAKQD